MIVAARALLLDAERWIEGGGLLVRAGRVERVLSSRRSVHRESARASGGFLDLGEVVLAPGLVDAHAHLDLSGLCGRVSAGAGFAAWIEALLRARSRLGPRDFESAVRSGAAALLQSGTTAVGDIDASGTSARIAGELGLRLVVYREIADVWDPGRRRATLARVNRALPRRVLVREGLSPHAPYTTSDELLRHARALATRRSLPLSIHWSETEDELRWLARGAGPFARLLPASPCKSGLARLEAAGLLGARTALVHGNHPQPGEPERLARAGITLVHCPGSHAFFGRRPFPARRYRRAGVELALGTDSLASNERLDMRAELALARRTLGLRPAEVFRLATTGGARALGLSGRIGELRPGTAADFVAHELSARSRKGALEELVSGLGAVAGVWVAGRARCGRLGNGSGEG